MFWLWLASHSAIHWIDCLAFVCSHSNENYLSWFSFIIFVPNCREKLMSEMKTEISIDTWVHMSSSSSSWWFCLHRYSLSHTLTYSVECVRNLIKFYQKFVFGSIDSTMCFCLSLSRSPTRRIVSPSIVIHTMRWDGSNENNEPIDSLPIFRIRFFLILESRTRFTSKTEIHWQINSLCDTFQFFQFN